MQHLLGMSPTGLAVMLDFLGLAPGIGGTEKWKDIQKSVSAAQHEVCEKALSENIEKEIAATKSFASIKVKKWKETEEGKSADTAAEEAKLNEIFLISLSAW